MAQKHDIPEYIDAPMTRAGKLELVASRRQIRSDAFVAAKWAAVNPILQLGEIGYETDTNKLKVGDGVTEWNDLGYIGGGSSLPEQTGHSGEFLTTDGTDASWGAVSEVPSTSGATEGDVLTVDSNGDAAWQAVNGLPSQTGNSGKFLTTDGTDASWSDKPLVNTATGTDSIMISNNATNRSGVVVIGKTAQITGAADYCVVAGDSAKCSSSGGVSLGVGAETAYDGVAIGRYAKATGGSAIQIGARGTNSVVGTLQVSLSDSSYVRKDYRLLDYDGTIPHGRLTNALASTTVTIAVADWNGGTTVSKTVSGLTATSVVFASPDGSSMSEWASAGVYASAQTTDTLTFTASSTPTASITVVVAYC